MQREIWVRPAEMIRCSGGLRRGVAGAGLVKKLELGNWLPRILTIHRSCAKMLIAIAHTTVRHAGYAIEHEIQTDRECMTRNKICNAPF